MGQIYIDKHKAYRLLVQLDMKFVRLFNLISQEILFDFARMAFFQD